MPIELVQSGEKEPTIQRGRVGSLSLYEITEYEFEVLQQPSQSSTLLNFAIFFWSVAISFHVALKTTKVDSDRTFAVLVLVTIVGYAAGTVMGGISLIAWLRNRSKRKDVIKRVRDRIPTPSAKD